MLHCASFKAATNKSKLSTGLRPSTSPRSAMISATKGPSKSGNASRRATADAFCNSMAAMRRSTCCPSQLDGMCTSRKSFAKGVAVLCKGSFKVHTKASRLWGVRMFTTAQALQHCGSSCKWLRKRSTAPRCASRVANSGSGRTTRPACFLCALQPATNIEGTCSFFVTVPLCNPSNNWLSSTGATDKACLLPTARLRGTARLHCSNATASARLVGPRSGGPDKDAARPSGVCSHSFKKRIHTPISSDFAASTERSVPLPATRRATPQSRKTALHLDWLVSPGPKTSKSSLILPASCAATKTSPKERSSTCVSNDAYWSNA